MRFGNRSNKLLWFPTISMLTGSELLAKIASLGQVPETVAALACGYCSPDGKAKIAAFKAALLAAHGLSFTKPARTTAGKPLSFNVACQKNGQVILSAGYAQLLGLQPGDRVDITHDAETAELVLAKTGTAAPALAVAA